MRMTLKASVFPSPFSCVFLFLLGCIGIMKIISSCKTHSYAHNLDPLNVLLFKPSFHDSIFLVAVLPLLAPSLDPFMMWR